MRMFKSFIEKIFRGSKNKEIIKEYNSFRRGNIIEPYTEIHYREDTIRLLFDISGAFEETIKIYEKDNTLVIRAHSIVGVYEKHLTINPEIISLKNASITYKNGVLAISFLKNKRKINEKFISVDFYYPVHMKSA